MNLSPPGWTSLFRRLRTCALVVVAAVAAGNESLAQDAARELLNSERIAASFGSYGVEVLETSPTVRVSSLYSTDGRARTCRTFAVVLYPATVDPALTDEPASIVAGGSIGAVFAAKGWIVRKTHLRYGTRVASERLAALMRIAAGSALAEHAYVLEVVRDGRAIEYAALVEIHHPAYLGASDLMPIYGPATARDRLELLERLLTAADEAAAGR
jgi:hypothetical protein